MLYPCYKGHIIFCWLHVFDEAVESQIVMALDISLGSIPDAVKEAPSACGVRDRKVRGFESRVFGR